MTSLIAIGKHKMFTDNQLERSTLKITSNNSFGGLKHCMTNSFFHPNIEQNVENKCFYSKTMINIGINMINVLVLGIYSYVNIILYFTKNLLDSLFHYTCPGLYMNMFRYNKFKWAIQTFS